MTTVTSKAFTGMFRVLFPPFHGQTRDDSWAVPQANRALRGEELRGRITSCSSGEPDGTASRSEGCPAGTSRSGQRRGEALAADQVIQVCSYRYGHAAPVRPILGICWLQRGGSPAGGSSSGCSRGPGWAQAASGCQQSSRIVALKAYPRLVPQRFKSRVARCSLRPVCDDITLEQERSAGILLALCDDFANCLIDRLYIPDPEDLGPARTLFRAFTGVASIAIVELRYFDLDYRSEFSATHETLFQTRAPGVERVHFFGGSVAEPAHLRDTAEINRESYCGYVIIRPQVPGTIGRSIVTPHGDAEFLADPEGLHRHVRIAVQEHVDLFGVPLTATGVPFMEQDQALLRCAHISAWICHYSAVLRGIVPRRATAQFHAAEASAGGFGRYGRPYPSGGLATQTISEVLGHLDLPAEVIESDVLERHRAVSWFDRKALVEQVRGNVAEDDEEGLTTLARTWIHENLTATVCRYLNSGIPVVLAREEERHTQVVVGYLRQEDLAGEAAADPEALHSDVVEFLVNDDQCGPYIRVPVNELVDEILYAEVLLASVIVPLPRGLWLSGGVAESAGARILAEAVSGRVPKDTAVESPLHQLHEDLLSDEDVLAVRSFATTGSDFKQGFATRVHDDAAARLVGLTRLPKYVWVVEMIDRRLRKHLQPAVRGTVVLDASQVVDDLSGLASVAPLIVHIPGQVFTVDQDDEDGVVYDDAFWLPTGSEPYETGRWHHDKPWLMAPERVAARAKTATTPA